MNNLPFWGIFIVLSMVATGANPAYQNYKKFLFRKFGYWNVVVSFAIIIVANAIGYLQSGSVMFFFLIPVDVIFLLDAICVYFEIRKIKSK